MGKLLISLALCLTFIGGCARGPTPEETAAKRAASEAQRVKTELDGDRWAVNAFRPVYVQAGHLAVRSEQCGAWESVYIRYKLAGKSGSAHWQSRHERTRIPELGLSRYDALMAEFDRGRSEGTQKFTAMPCSIVIDKTLNLLTEGIDVATLRYGL